MSRISIVEPERIIDLGCGPGNSTAILRERYPEADIIGLDSSPDMIEQAHGRDLNVEWRLGDISSLEPRDMYDLIFANAALQWIPDHK